MKIAMFSYGMALGPEALCRGLGGSETAQVCMMSELAALGHEVHHFTNLDEASWEGMRRGSATWRSLGRMGDADPEHYDFGIVCRRPDLHVDGGPITCARKVLWIQDFWADPYPRTYADHFREYAEIWCVSQWQAKQWRTNHQRGEFWLPNMWVTRNGINDVRAGMLPKKPGQLCFVSRPERGLRALVQPGGIMDHLPDHHLVVCGYDDYPAEYRAWYDDTMRLLELHPRIKHVGSLANHHVRHLIQQSEAMLLPTNYAETSCMAAREAISVLTPVLTTPSDENFMSTRGSGAMEETLNQCGAVIEAKGEYGTPEWCAGWGSIARNVLGSPEITDFMRRRMLERSDLWWPAVARHWTARMEFHQWVEVRT